jgi:hypothetical protein
MATGPNKIIEGIFEPVCNPIRSLLKAGEKLRP